MFPAWPCWVYLELEGPVFTVGFYDPNGRWVPESDYADREEAAERVNYLNGAKKKKDDGWS